MKFVRGYVFKGRYVLGLLLLITLLGVTMTHPPICLKFDYWNNGNRNIIQEEERKYVQMIDCKTHVLLPSSSSNASVGNE